MPKFTAQRINRSGLVGLPLIIIPKHRPGESAKSAAYRVTHANLSPFSGIWIEVNDVIEKEKMLGL